MTPRSALGHLQLLPYTTQFFSDLLRHSQYLFEAPAHVSPVSLQEGSQ